MKKSINKLLFASTILLAANPVFGSDQVNHTFGQWYLSESQPGWYFDGLIGIESEPTYAGSDDYEVEADVSARAIYKSQSGHRYFVNLGEIGAVFELSSDLLLSAVLEYEEAREAEAGSTLDGFEEVESTVEGQLTLSRRIGNFSFGGVLQPDLLGRDKGLVTFIAAAYDKTVIPEKLHLHTGIDFSWGDSEHMQTEFGISETAAANSNLPIYNAGAGYKSTSVGLGLEYWLNKKFSLLSVVEFEHYATEAADSPLIEQEGSDVTYEAAIGVRYNF